MVVPDDVEGFARGVLEVLRWPALRRELSDQAEPTSSKCWSSTAMAERMLRLYEEVLRSRSGGRPRRACSEPNDLGETVARRAEA